eukprot:1187441-Prorocentrum_minimum.AAC.3
MDVKGNSEHVKGNRVDITRNSMDVKGNSEHVKGNPADVKRLVRARVRRRRAEPKWEGWDWVPAAVVVSSGKNDMSQNTCKDAWIFHSKFNYQCSDPLTHEQLSEVPPPHPRRCL